jgi:hypothetical protein
VDVGVRVSLTGLPLLVVCWLGTKLVVGLTVIGWRYGGRARVFTRTVSILACEAVALFSLGVVANRALDLYPSWAALLHPVPRPEAVAAPVVRLDGWLHSRDVRGGRHGVTFTWEPPGWTGWGLAAPPTMSVPQAYFTGSSRHLPVIVVAAPPQDGREVLGAVPAAPAVVVFLPTDRPAVGAIADQLPYALNLDVRVEPHGWALIGLGSDARPVLAALAQRPERYQDAAVIADGAAPLPAPVLAQVRRGSAQQYLCLVAAEPGAVLPRAVRVLLVAAAPARLAAALRWVDPLLPAPLDPPETGPIGIPPKPRPHTGPHPRGTPPAPVRPAGQTPAP